jgi:hypothetical protein
MQHRNCECGGKQRRVGGAAATCAWGPALYRRDVPELFLHNLARQLDGELCSCHCDSKVCGFVDQAGDFAVRDDWAVQMRESELHQVKLV